MTTTIPTLKHIDAALADIERSMAITGETPLDSRVVRIEFVILEPAPISQFILSVAGQEIDGIGTAAEENSVHLLPYTIGWSEVPELIVTTAVSLVKTGISLFESIGFAPGNITGAAGPGTMNVSSDCTISLRLSDPVTLLTTFVKLISQPNAEKAITSLSLKAPFERLRNIVLSSNFGEAAGDICWTILPPRDLTAAEKRLVSKLPDFNAIFPAMVFDSDTSRLLANRSPEALATDADRIFPPDTGKIRVPVMPVVTGPIAAEPSTAEVLRRYFNLLWESTRSAGFRGRSVNEAMDSRIEKLLDILCEPPDSVYALLRQRCTLQKLKNLPDPDFEIPGTEPFVELRREMFEHMKSAVQAREKLAADETKAHHAELIEAIRAFFDQASSEEVIAREQDVRAEITAIMDTENEVPVEALSSMIGQLLHTAEAKLSQEIETCRKALKKTEKQLRSATAGISEESHERFGQIEFFWSTFVPMAIDKIELAIPDDEVSEVCQTVLKEFLDYLALTPAEEAEFGKCLEKKWPSMAAGVNKSLDALMDDTADIWQLKIGQELSRLEEFRKANVRFGSAISSHVSLAKPRKPTLSEQLDVTVKKAGFMKLLKIATDREKWRMETESAIRKSAKETMGSYVDGVISWFTTVRDRLTAIKKSIDKLAEKTIEKARMTIDEAESGSLKNVEEYTARKKDREKELENINVAKRKIDSLRAEWSSLAARIPSTE